jgi:signal transduction histidine kinase
MHGSWLAAPLLLFLLLLPALSIVDSTTIMSLVRALASPNGQLTAAEGANASDTAHLKDRLADTERQVRERDSALQIAQERMEEARQRVAFAEHSAHEVNEPVSVGRLHGTAPHIAVTS